MSVTETLQLAQQEEMILAVTELKRKASEQRQIVLDLAAETAEQENIAERNERY